jgi:glycosyltransferase involved in cell wall biosynthesis
MVLTNPQTMKRVLILAYDFPPYVSVGGLRPFNWYKYLGEFGVYPYVITRQWENSHGNFLDYISESKSKKSIIENDEKGTLIRAPYKPNISNRLLIKYGENRHKLIRKCITGYFEFGQFVSKTGPKVEIYNAAKQFLKENKVDVIVATGDPFVLFGYAALLSKEFGIPWIADYRDPWSQNKSHSKNIIFRIWNKYFEKKIVSSASQIITVSDFLKVTIGSLIENVPIHILPNGYDPEVIDEIGKIDQGSEIFQIAFVGTIYEWHPIRSFLKILNQFAINNPEVKFRFNLYGINITAQIEELIENEFAALKKYVYITPKIPNDILLKKLAQNNVMLLFNYYSFMGTKIFDYLGIRRKILMCYSNDEETLKLKDKYYTMDEIIGVSHQLQIDLIEETKSGIVIENEENLMIAINDLSREFEINRKIECNSINVENYSRKIQVKKLAEIIKSL